MSKVQGGGRRRPRAGRYATIVVGVIAVAVGALVASGAAAKAEPTPAEQAKALADAVINANTTTQRVSALRDVASALNIGVYKPDGTQVLAGDEWGPDDFYLYTFELNGMADAYDRGSNTSLGDLAAVLSSLSTNGHHISADKLRSILVSQTADSEANPNDPLSLLPLMVRELGLHHGGDSYDLAQSFPKNGELDPVQRFLLSADVYLTVARQIHQSQGAVASDLPAQTSAPCGSFQGDSGTWQKVGKIAGQVIPKLGKIAKKLETVTDGAQAAVLAQYVEITKTVGKDPLKADVGWKKHSAPGKWTAQLTLKMTKVPKEVVDCGKLAKIKFPPEGPLADVPVDWTYPQTEGDPRASTLDDWGKLSCPPSKSCDDAKTNKNGQASITFKANSYRAKEPHCCLIDTTSTGSLNGEADYLKKFGSWSATAVSLLAPKTATWNWNVKYDPCVGPPGSTKRGVRGAERRRC